LVNEKEDFAVRHVALIKDNKLFSVSKLVCWRACLKGKSKKHRVPLSLEVYSFTEIWFERVSKPVMGPQPKTMNRNNIS
jgi:hypothetical protein